MKKRKKYTWKKPDPDRVTDEKKEEIIQYWKTHKENGGPTLARVFNLKQTKIDSILDEYLKQFK